MEQATAVILTSAIILGLALLSIAVFVFYKIINNLTKTGNGQSTSEQQQNPQASQFLCIEHTAPTNSNQGNTQSTLPPQQMPDAHMSDFDNSVYTERSLIANGFTKFKDGFVREENDEIQVVTKGCLASESDRPQYFFSMF